jgi:hypothetical protein
MSRSNPKHCSLQVECLENRTTPAPLGLSQFPAAGAAGIAMAASYNGSSQAGSHSPMFQASSAAAQAASPTLPAAAGTGIGMAAGHNGSSQAGSHSPVFHS